MKLWYDENHIEIGVDEAGRGCLAGRVYAAAVIWPHDLVDEFQGMIKDSKLLSKGKREMLTEYIIANAIDYGVSYSDNNTIDSVNILNATFLAMHKAIDMINIDCDTILVDGTLFKPYKNTPHICMIDGDARYTAIAAASILAKTYHDRYILDLLQQEPDLEKYGWRTNMSYGTKTHIDAIQQYGITKYHRKTFKTCSNYSI